VHGLWLITGRYHDVIRDRGVGTFRPAKATDTDRPHTSSVSIPIPRAIYSQGSLFWWKRCTQTNNWRGVACDSLGVASNTPWVFGHFSPRNQC